MTTRPRVALVTGAGTGIGKAVALALGKGGFSVALAGRRAANLDATVEEGARIGAEMRPLPTDVQDPVAVKALFQAIREQWGRIDVLFNNAGRGSPVLPFEDVTYDQWRSVLDTNVTGSFLCAQQAFQLMKTQDPIGGRIINNGSLSAYSPRPHSAPYTTTKHAISGLTKAISLDGRPYGIACSQIDIGNAATEINHLMTEAMVQPYGASIVEPSIDVERVAQAVLYIANLPLDTNVLFLTLMATTMPYVGRG